MLDKDLWFYLAFRGRQTNKQWQYYYVFAHAFYLHLNNRW